MIVKISKTCNNDKDMITIYSNKQKFASHMQSKKALLFNLIGRISDETILDKMIMDMRYNMKLISASYDKCYECDKDDIHEEFQI